MTRTQSGGAAFWSATGGKGRLRMRLTPNSSRDEICSVVTLADGRDVLVANVRAVPEKGKANLALEKLVATALRVAPSMVNVVSGHKDRVKTVRIESEDKNLAVLLLGLTTQKTRMRNGDID